VLFPHTPRGEQSLPHGDHFEIRKLATEFRQAIERCPAFSASSRNFDLNGEASTARTKQNSPIIPPA
jgi:hypothetical protein